MASSEETDLFFPVSDDEDEIQEVAPPAQAIDSSAATPNGLATIGNGRVQSSSSANGGSSEVRTSATGGRSSPAAFSDARTNNAVASSSTNRPALSPNPSDAADEPYSDRLPRHVLDQMVNDAVSRPVRRAFSSGYLGEFVCEGWSLSKGKGYCSPGSTVFFERPKIKQPKAEKSSNWWEETLSTQKLKPAKLSQGKLVKSKLAEKSPTRSELMAAFTAERKAASAAARKPVRKPEVDQIIRFRNQRDFEVGRLSVTEASFLVHLLDTGVISLKGHVIDCPAVLSTGATILLNVRVYLTEQAFEQVENVGRGELGTFWQEQQETVEEEAMRKRKDALGLLFGRIGVKPLQSNALLMAQKKNGAAEINEKSLQHFPDGRGKTGLKSGAVPAKGKAQTSARNSEDDEDDEDSGDEAEKLNEDQLDELDTIYRKAQMGDKRLEETDPPDTFVYTLRPYQKQALTWMNARETGDTSVRDQSLHPLWEEYAFKKEQEIGQPIEIEDDDDLIDPARKFYFNPYSGELSLDFPTSKTKSNGGILADAMGMGKTCMMAALIHLNRSSETQSESSLAPADDEAARKRRKFTQVTLSNQWRAVPTAPKAADVPRATLVVCPVSLASQWHEELGKMSHDGTITSFMWYGGDRADIDRILQQEGKKRVDVIITSYGTLTSEFQKWRKAKDKLSYEGGSIYDHEFLRIVLDEAHNIKNRTALVSKACYELKGQRRWALTGTPIVNRLEDLYSLLHFLQLEPWGQYSFFRSFVTIPFLNQDPKALNVVQYILESCLLRREKTMRDKDGRLIVDLPPKHTDLQVLDFSRPERQIYKHLEDRAKRRFIQLDAEGRAMSNYTSILAMLMKLRQCVDHPLLVLSKTTEEDASGDRLLDPITGDGTGSLKEMIAKYAGSGGSEGQEDTAYATQVLQEIADNETTAECFICANEIFDEVLLPCYHRGCQDCFVNYIGSCEDQNKPALCPMCGEGPYGMSDLRAIQRRRKRINPITGTYTDENGLPSSQGGTAITIGKVDLVSSTKLRVLARKLETMRQADPEFKALVFSQFTSFLDLIETTLTKAGLRWLRFDGTMSQPQRAATIEEFGKKSKEPLILLISLKAGGVGLNLTMANHVFMMDTWWNEAIEQQAIDRVHRLGQNKEVYVTRYIIKGTVEKRIMKIQRSKTALVNASLAGGQQKDKQTSLADIKKIFGLDDDDSEDEGF